MYVTAKEGIETKHTAKSDTELLDLLETDPDEGIAALLEVYSGLVWQVCARRLRNHEDIKECVNDTFADFCAVHSRFDPDKGSLRGFLCTIADRRALERYRKIRAANKAEARFRELSGYAEEEIRAMQAMSRTELDQALDALEPAEAQLLRMKYYNGLTFREIAQALQLPYETVKKRSQRSLRKLKKQFD
jgi:RNA polymerase sigma factor (sigma-70 family)